MTHDQQTYQRAATAALAGLFVQLTLAIGMLLLGLWSQSPGLNAATWHVFGGLPIWIILFLIYNQHRIERAEALEAEHLTKGDQRSAAIFDQHADDLDLARRRLDRLYKWGLPIVGVLVAIYLLAVGVTWFIGQYSAMQRGDLTRMAVSVRANSYIILAVATAIAFISFVVARYIAGMTEVKQWQLLRGGAGYLMGTAFIGVLTIVAAVGDALFTTRSGYAVLALVVPVFMVIVAAEIGLSLLLGAYRPRSPGEVPRAPFDSRLLGWFTSPESIAKIVNETINYQFGFEVSRSWFYRLLSKAITPLIIFGLLTLIGISSIVMVGPDEQAIITRFGRKIGLPRGPGAHFKLPWPISRAELYPTGQVHQITFGSARGGIKRQQALLWTNTHGEGVEDFFVTAPPPELAGPGRSNVVTAEGETAEQERTPGMSLVGLQVVVQFRVTDLEQFVNTVADPQQLVRASRQLRQSIDSPDRDIERYEDPCPILRNIAERNVNAYFVGKDIDTLLGSGRIDAGNELLRQIQHDADAHGLGVTIVFLGLSGMHPPQDNEVAEAFLKQIGALQERQTAIEEAQRKRTELLASVAGSRRQADLIKAAMDGLTLLQARVDAAAAPEAAEELRAKIEQQQQEVERLVAQAGGEAAQVIYDAMAYRWNRSIVEGSRARRFEAELAAFRSAPNYYKMRRYIEVLTEGMRDGRKFVIGVSGDKPPVIRFDFKESGSVLSDIVSPR